MQDVVRRLDRVLQARFAECLLVGAYAAVLASRLRPNIFIDDAAITLRYVERLTTGHGLTYNDHEHVLGTSNPLYALILVFVTLLGESPENAAALVGFVLFVVSAIQATYLTKRLTGSRLFAVATGVILATDPFYRYMSLSGMESVLSVVLALGVVTAILNEKETAAGVLLGLAIWNKLDAATLAIALTVAWLVFRRRLPIRIAALSAAVVLPWALFALAYYGSPIPRSFVAKAFLQPRDHPFDHLWVWKFLSGGHRVVFAGLAIVALALLGPLRFEKSEKEAMVTLGAWFVLHFAALSTVDLGDYYPWYLTVLVPPVVILTGTLAGRILARSTGTRYRAGVAVALAIFFWFGGEDSARATLHDLHEGNPVTQWEAFDDDRRLAGIFLRQYAEPQELLRTAYGWPAFASKLRTNDISLLNSKDLSQPAEYRVEHGLPVDSGNRGPQVPEGFVPLANFNLASDLSPGFCWFTVFGRISSSITHLGARYLQYRLTELAAPAAYSDAYGLTHVQITGTDLFAHPPSGATFVVENARQPVHVVFTPGFAPTVPVDKTDGVTFELRAQRDLLYLRHVRPTEPEEPAIVEVPGAEQLDRTTISFVTGPGPKGDTTCDWAIWKSVKVVVGDAFIDVWQLRNPKMMQAWARHNPIGTSSRVDQLARRNHAP